MKKNLVLRIIICIIAVATMQYLYLQKQNELTKLRLEIPKITSDLRRVKDENSLLRFEVDRFENPANLLYISKKEEFAHLHNPLFSEILTLHLSEEKEIPLAVEKQVAQRTFKHSTFFGAKQ